MAKEDKSKATESSKESKKVKLSLEFPVSVNGVVYEGEVEVAEHVAAGIQDVLDGVAAEKEHEAELKAAASPAEPEAEPTKSN